MSYFAGAARESGIDLRMLIGSHHAGSGRVISRQQDEALSPPAVLQIAVEAGGGDYPGVLQRSVSAAMTQWIMSQFVMCAAGSLPGSSNEAQISADSSRFKSSCYRPVHYCLIGFQSYLRVI